MDSPPTLTRGVNVVEEPTIKPPGAVDANSALSPTTTTILYSIMYTIYVTRM